jgi:hypothetical protein
MAIALVVCPRCNKSFEPRPIDAKALAIEDALLGNVGEPADPLCDECDATLMEHLRHGGRRGDEPVN